MSSVPAPDVPQIERALDALLERTADARLLGMRAPARRAWPPEIVRRGRAFSLAWCASELEIRERLDAAERTGEGLVVLTPVDATSLSADILARFPRARLEQVDRWAALRTAFRARDVDPRLRGHGWLADHLLASVPASGYPPVAGGLLDLETVWLALQEHSLGLPDGRVDAASLLAWSLDPACTQRLVALGEPARSAAVERLTGQGGPGAGHILAAVLSGRGDDALPAALACGVVFGTDALESGLRDAAVRLEPFFGGVSIDRRAGSVLADAARSVTKRLAMSRPEVARAVQARASSLLVELRADQWAANSPAVEIGLDARSMLPPNVRAGGWGRISSGRLTSCRWPHKRSTSCGASPATSSRVDSIPCRRGRSGPFQRLLLG